MSEIEKRVLGYFSLLKKHNLLGTSYLFVGGTLSLVVNLAKLINCQKDEFYCSQCSHCVKIEKGVHPDFLVLRPQGNYIKIEEIREAQRFLSFKNFTALRKVLIIENVHLLTTEAANAFLKTLEEPPKNSFLALVTSRIDMVLPTINSRCKKIYLPFREKYEFDSQRRDIIDFLMGKDIFIKDRGKFSSFLLGLIFLFRDYLVFLLTKDINMLIERDNYEIILRLNYTLNQAKNLEESFLRIYNSLENVNLNLASNLLRVKRDGR